MIDEIFFVLSFVIGIAIMTGALYFLFDREDKKFSKGDTS